MASTRKFFFNCSLYFNLFRGSLATLSTVFLRLVLVLLISVSSGGFLYSQNIIQGVEEQDYNALVDLYNNTNGAGWNNSTGWLDSSVPVNDWYGVTVSNNRVTTIDLRTNNLSGILVSSFDNLSALEVLRLNQNNLSGTIPTGVGEMANLNTLYLSNNKFSGSLPAGLANLSHLGVVAVNNNNLTSLLYSALNIFAFYVDNNKLTFGDLIYQQGGAGLRYAPQKVVSDNVKRIIQSGGSYTIQGADGHAESYYKWYKDGALLAEGYESKFTIDNFSAGDAGAYTYTITNVHFPELTLHSGTFQLDIKEDDGLVQGVPEAEYNALVDLYNSAGGDSWNTKSNWLDPQALVGSWAGVTVVNNQVTAISLRNNNLTGSLPASLANLSGLIEFTVDNNQLSGSVPDGFTSLSRLNKFHIQQNSFTSLTSTALSYAEDINVSSNKLTFGDLMAQKNVSGITYAPQKVLTDNISEEVLVGASYTITGADGHADSYYKWFKNGAFLAEGLEKTYTIEGFSSADEGVYTYEVTNANLPDLSLQSGTFTLTVDPNSEGLVPNNVEFAALQELYESTGGANWKSSTNWLQGSTAGEMEQWFGISMKDGDVSKIELPNNNLQGPLPESLGELTGLDTLSLYSNSLTALPESLGNLTNLQVFHAFSNQLSSVPESIGNLSNLHTLRLHYNKLTSIPSSIGNLTKLDVLAVHFNQLTNLPESIGNMTNLEILYIEGNQLTSLPESISSLSRLTTIYAKQNHFSSLPSILAELPSFKNLYVHENQLTFEAIEQFFTGADTDVLADFKYAPQNTKDPVSILTEINHTERLDAQDNASRNSFQWQKKINDVWEDIAGATASTYETSLAAGEAEAFYRCYITNEWITDLTLYSPVYHLEASQDENIIGDVPGNITSGFCSIGKYYTPDKGVASGDNIPTEGGAGVSGIDIDEKNNKVYVGAAASDIWVLDRSTNSGTILGKNKPIEGDHYPNHSLSIHLDDEKQLLYFGTWGSGLWTYDIQKNIGKTLGVGWIPENGGDTIRGQVLNDIAQFNEKLFLSYFQFSYYQGGLYIWDQAAKTGKLLNASTTGVGGKYEVQGDPMPGNKCRTSYYHIRNGKEYIYIGIENYGLWEFNVTDNIGRLLTPDNTQPGGSQEVIGDPMVDHEMYKIHFVGDTLIAGFWRGTAVWIYDVSTNESTVLSYETTRPGGIHAVDGDYIPEYFELGGNVEVDYSRGTVYYALEKSPEDLPVEERSAIWEYELKTNKARLHTYLDEGENYGATGRFVVKKDEINNKLYTTSWPTKTGGGLLEISYSDIPCNPIVADENKDRNWEYQKIYDAAGNVIGEGKQFYDEFGKPTQAQSKSFSKHQVLASQQLYDKLGNGVLGTMPAPTNNRAFNYKEGFVKNTSGQDYSYQDFDEENLDTPAPVSNAEEGTLGWYYSQNNTEEARTAVTQYPYSRSWTEKTADPKIAKSAGPGDQYRMGSGHEVEGERQKVTSGELNHYWSLRKHFVETDDAQLHKNGYKYISTGPDGQQSVSFTDAGGKTLATALLINGSYDYWSYTYYNDLGQVVASVAPEGVNTASSAYPAFVTLFKYDHLGRTIEASSSDAGTSYYVYSYDGNIRFSQNEEQRSSSPARFSYTNYDYQGRLIESGEYVMSGDSPYIFETHETATDNPKSIFTLVDKTGAAGALDAERCRNVTKMAYDLQASDFPADELHPAQQFTYGQLTKSENEQVKSWYSYDEQGRLNWMKQEIDGLGTKTVDYTYDFLGNMLEVAYQKGQPDAFYHHYSYDRDQRLEAVYTSKDGQSKKLQARYEYYLHGPLKREVLGNKLQGIDYTYTIDGALKAMNHFDSEKDPGKDGEENGVAPDVFGLTLEYHEQDYTGAGYDGGSFAAASYSNHFNGLPKAQNWRSPVDGGTPRSYTYQYDETNQLEGADWGDVNGTAGAYSFSPSATNQHQVQVGNYDKHGNIGSLHRKGDTGNTLADFSYEYIPNTNRLAKVSQGGEEVIGYQYNAIGQLTSQVEDTLSMYMEYDAYGMVTAVFTDAAKQSPMLRFAYDDKGMRLSKTTYDEAGQEVWKTWYVYDAAGTLLSLYEENVKENIAALQIEVPIYGASRIGQYKPLAETYLYEIKDHTGSVRAVIGDTEPQTYMATMEQEQAGEEEWNFVDFRTTANRDGKDTRVVVPEWLNHTPVAQTGKSPEAVRLNAAQNVRQGPRKTLRVFPGDKVEAGVFAKYLRLNENSSLNADAVIAALAGAGGYTVSTDASGVTSVSDDFGNLASFGGASSGEAGPPNASLSYQLFDLNYNLLDEGFIKVSTDAALDAENLQKAHEEVLLPTLHIQQPGYLNIELRHDLLDGQAEQAEVYFDDFEVTHNYSNVVVAYDYYPYGLPMENRKLEREQTRHNYQGEYAEKDEETGYHAFQLRFYDARIGRSVSPDPYGQFASPYVGMGNLGHISSDPDGGWSGAFSSPLTRTLVFAGAGAVAGGAISGTWEGALTGAGVGALGANAGAVGSFLGNNIGAIGSAASGALRGMQNGGRKSGIYIMGGADVEMTGISKTTSDIAYAVRATEIYNYSPYFDDNDEFVTKIVRDIKRGYTSGQKVLLYGYSKGGDLALQVSRKLNAAKIPVSLLITVDAAYGWDSHNINRSVPGNVNRTYNFYQTIPGALIPSYGGPNLGPGLIWNFDLTRPTINHSNIDEATKKISILLMKVHR